MQIVGSLLGLRPLWRSIAVGGGAFGDLSVMKGTPTQSACRKSGRAKASRAVEIRQLAAEKFSIAAGGRGRRPATGYFDACSSAIGAS
jgi:hypothetical protein